MKVVVLLNKPTAHLEFLLSSLTLLSLLRRILQCKLNWFQQCFAGEKV